MTFHDPRDGDPLYVVGPDYLDRPAVSRPVRVYLVVAVLIVIVAALFVTQVAASRAEPEQGLHPPGSTSLTAGSQALPGALRPVTSTAAEDNSASLHIADLLGIRGTATWYCGHGSACTHGYQGSDLVAAIDPTLGIRKGSVVTVSSRGRAVAVTIVDVCACAGRRLIDLTSGAFARLAPLSAGVIRIELEVGAGKLPPTDTEDSDD